MQIWRLVKCCYFDDLVANNVWIFVNPGLYYGITIAIVSLATAMTSFTLNIHHKGTSGERVPEVVKTICFKFLARVLCLQQARKTTEAPIEVWLYLRVS